MLLLEGKNLSVCLSCLCVCLPPLTGVVVDAHRNSHLKLISYLEVATALPNIKSSEGLQISQHTGSSLVCI